MKSACARAAAICALSIFLAACEREAQISEVSLTTSKNIWCTLPILASERGFFEDEGLNVSIEFVQAAKFAMDALVAGSTDFATVVEANIAYLGFTGNRDVSVIATVVEAHDGAIVARRSAGISSDSEKTRIPSRLTEATSYFVPSKIVKSRSMVFSSSRSFSTFVTRALR